PPLHLQRTNRMPSSPPVSSDLLLDLDHLKRMTLGDEELEQEVLRMFVAQASGLVAALAEEPADAASLVHTLKGSARAIGGFGGADHAAVVETAIGQGADSSSALAALEEAVAATRTAIEARLRRA